MYPGSTYRDGNSTYTYKILRLSEEFVYYEVYNKGELEDAEEEWHIEEFEEAIRDGNITAEPPEEGWD